MQRKLVKRILIPSWMFWAFLIVACRPASLPIESPIASPLPSTLPTPPSLPLGTSLPSPVTSPFATATTFPEIRVTVVDSAATVYTPTIHILDFSFIDAQRGWILGTWCQNTCPILIRATSDGGRTWQALPALKGQEPWIYPRPDLSLVSSIRFADAQHGWAFQPGFFSTSDGGKTWIDEQRSVVAVEPAGGSLWAIEQTGDQFGLLFSADLGRTWKPTPNQPPLQGRTVQLVRPTSSDAWILTEDSESRASLFVTHDGGMSWQELPEPPKTGCFDDRSLAMSTNQRLWMVCGGGLATAMQLKMLYTSMDGGTTWKIMADTSAPGSGQPTGILPISGHLGNPSQFAVASPLDAFLALDRATLFATHDGGRTWEYAIPYDLANRADDGMGPVRFLDAEHGWMVAPPDWFFRTTDGGKTWERVTVK